MLAGSSEYYARLAALEPLATADTRGHIGTLRLAAHLFLSLLAYVNATVNDHNADLAREFLEAASARLMEGLQQVECSVFDSAATPLRLQ